AAQERAEAELLAHLLRLEEVGALRRPPAADEEVERHAAGEDVVVVELRHGGDLAPPAGVAQRVAVEPAQEQHAGARPAQPGQERSEGRLAAAGVALEEDALAVLD